MQSGRIAPIFRQFFGGTLSAKNPTDSQSQQKQREGEPEREPTREEALEALDRLSQQEEFQKNSLRAELRQLEGRNAILVTNTQGMQVKVIRGGEILRLLESAGGGRSALHLGRILDRRV
jgi:hypothetical protein